MRKILMPALLSVACLGTASLFGATASVAQEYPWCANYRAFGGQNCGFVSYRQCMAAINGNGGFCSENPFFRGGYVERFVPRHPRTIYVYQD